VTVTASAVRTAKAMGLRNLPSKTLQVNTGWVLAANMSRLSCKTPLSVPSLRLPDGQRHLPWPRS
jgi:hypothetical protein